MFGIIKSRTTDHVQVVKRTIKLMDLFRTLSNILVVKMRMVNRRFFSSDESTHKGIDWYVAIFYLTDMHGQTNAVFGD